MPQQDKIREIDIIVPALRYLAESPAGALTSAELNWKLEGLFQPTGINAERNANGWTAFSQIVRNIVSNRHVGRNMINRGFAQYDGSHIAITEKGWSLLSQIGY